MKLIRCKQRVAFFVLMNKKSYEGKERAELFL